MHPQQQQPPHSDAAPVLQFPEIEFPEAAQAHKRRATADAKTRADHMAERMRDVLDTSDRVANAIKGARQMGVIQGQREGWHSGWRWGLGCGTAAGGALVAGLIKLGSML